MQSQFMESMLRAQGVTISPAHMRGNPGITQSAGQQFQNFLTQRIQQSNGVGGVQSRQSPPTSLSETLTLD